jgi:hypothetical protein
VLTATGAYLFKCYTVDTSPDYFETYTGILQWYVGGTNNSVATPVLVTSAGHAQTSNPITFQVQRSMAADGRNLRFQMARAGTWGVQAFNFEFKRLL